MTRRGGATVALAAVSIAFVLASGRADPGRAALLPSPVTPAPLAPRVASPLVAPHVVVPAAANPRASSPAGAAARPVPSPTTFTTLGGIVPATNPRLPTAPLDVLGAVRFALTHAPTLLAQRAQVASLDATFQRDRAAEYPSLTGELQNQLQRSSNTSGNLAQFGITPQTNFSQNTAQISSVYNVYNGTAQLVAEQARRDVEAARQTLRSDEETIAGDVANAAYQLVALHASVALDQNDLRYQQLLLVAARANERVGRVAGVDVVRAQVAVTRSASALLGAETAEANARDALAVRIGAPVATRFAIPDEVPEPPLPRRPVDALVALAQQERPDALAARATLRAAKLADAAVDDDLRPTFQAFGSFGSQVSPTSFVAQQQQIDASNAAVLANYNLEKQLFPNATIPPPALAGPVVRGQPGFYQFGLTSTFQVPLYDYGVRAANHHAARAQITSSDAAYANTLDGIDADVRANVRTTASDRTQVELARASAAYARESARISQLQYRNGLISFTDVTQTEQTALAAENDLVTARVTYVVQFVRFRLALGPPDTGAAADLRGL